jgi:7-cyano-7-deazaguanine synthase
LSGGLDSTTVAAKLYRDETVHTIQAITFNYGQRHIEAETDAAASVADWYSIPWQMIDLTPLSLFYKSPLISAANEPVPVNEDPRRPGVAPTYVPRRNTVMLALAALIAEQRNLNFVAYGAHATDANYPDCTPQFAEAFSHMLHVGSHPDNVVQLYAPLIDLHKAEVVELAAELEAPIDITHSCYQGKQPACGVCDTCQSRIHAFKQAGYIDPIDYEIAIDWGDAVLFPLPE